MAEERDPIVPPLTSPLAAELPVTTPLTGSDLDEAARSSAFSGVAAPFPGAIGTQPAGTGLPGAANTSAEATEDPDAIREQIERTREDMSQTLNELQERLSPQHLAQQAKDSVREATVGRVQQLMGTAGERASEVAARAQGAAGVAAEQVREHPIPVALAGAGAGLVWWLMRRSSSRNTWSSDDMYDWDDADVSYDRDYASLETRSDDDWSGRDSRGGGLARMLRDNPVPASIAVASIGYMLWNRRSTTGFDDEGVGVRSAYAYGDDVELGGSVGGDSTASSIADGARDMSRQARQKAAALGDKVSDSVRSAQEKASDVSQGVTRRLRTARTQTSSQWDRWLNENPLAVGVVAMAAGAVVGLTAPRTETEDQVMGASRDALVDKATDSAQQLKEQVREKVQTVASDLAKSQESTGESSSGSTGSSYTTGV